MCDDGVNDNDYVMKMKMMIITMLMVMMMMMMMVMIMVLESQAKHFWSHKQELALASWITHAMRAPPSSQGSGTWARPAARS